MSEDNSIPDLNVEIKNLSIQRQAGRYILNLFIFFVFITICIHLIIWIIKLWPANEGNKYVLKLFSIPLPDFEINAEQRYIILVALGGALGSFIHAATSFIDFVGNRKLVYTWVPWYLMRPFIGSSLAIIFYLLIRGGLFTTTPITANENKNIPQVTFQDTVGRSKEVKDSLMAVNFKQVTPPKENSSKEQLPINPFGVMAIACLAGMFSKQATDKLREVFESLFHIKEEDKTTRTDKLK
jgi:hypothetical protein